MKITIESEEDIPELEVGREIKLFNKRLIVCERYINIGGFLGVQHKYKLEEIIIYNGLEIKKLML